MKQAMAKPSTLFSKMMKRRFFYLAVICLIHLMSSQGIAQKVSCPKGQKPGKNGTCVPISPPPPSQPKSCAITVKVEGASNGVQLSLSNNPGDGCRTITRKKKPVPYGYSETRTLSDDSQATFSGFLCKCNHTLTAKLDGYDFTNGGRQNVINPKPGDIITFKATLREKPKPVLPCNGGIEPTVLKWDGAPEKYAISPQSACREKVYFNEHRLKPVIGGYKVAVNLASNQLAALKLELYLDQQPVVCEAPLFSSNAQSQTSCLLQSDREYLLRITGSGIAESSNLNYSLSANPILLTVEGFNAQLAVLESDQVLGSVKLPPSTPSLFNSLNRQLVLLYGEGQGTPAKSDPAANEKLAQAATILERLADSKTDAPLAEQGLVRSALGIIYRYHKKDFIKAKQKEAEAIEQGAFARFKVTIGEKKDARQFPKFWLLIGKHGMSLEPLGENANEKPSPLPQKIKLTTNPISMSRDFDTPLSKNVPVQCVKISIEKKDFYIIPLSYDRDEANTIADFIKNLLNAGK